MATSRFPGPLALGLALPGCNGDGTFAPQAAAFTVPALLFLIDRHPR